MSRLHGPLRVAPTITLLTGAILLIGCGESAQQSLLGKWQVRSERQDWDIELDEQCAAVIWDIMMENMDITLDFQSRGEMEMELSFGPMKVPLRGDWSVLCGGEKAAMLEFRVQYPRSDETKTHRGAISFLDNRTIRFVPSESDDTTRDPLSQNLTLLRLSE